MIGNLETEPETDKVTKYAVFKTVADTFCLSALRRIRGLVNTNELRRSPFEAWPSTRSARRHKISIEQFLFDLRPIMFANASLVSY